MSNVAHPIRQRGAGLVETMVGILIGMLVVLTIYSLLSTTEGYKRTTTGASDAQITGLFSQFVLGRDAGNGGNGILLAGDDNLNYLINCTKDEAGGADLSLKPIPVLITDSGSASVSDSFISFSSGSAHVNWPVNFVEANSLAGAPFVVQSPNGFTNPAPNVTPYWVVAAANDGSGRCKRFQVTASVAGPNAALGEVTLTTVPASTITYVANTSKLMNLGPVGQASRINYEVWNATANEPCGLTNTARRCQLFSTDLMAGGARNPLAANVVLMKVQYGVDTTPTPDGQIDCWTAADNGNVCADGKDYSPANVQQNFTMADLNRIMAVRIAVVVRSDEPDLKDDTLLAANRPNVVLFNCSTNNAACQSRIVLPKGNAGQIIADYWRYRVYETVVPLRNSIYVGTLPP